MTRVVRSGFFLARSALRLPLFHGMHRFIGPLLLREGCKLIQVPVKHRPRVQRSLALQPLESFTLRDHRLARCRLADAPAGALSRDPEPAITEVTDWQFSNQKTWFQPMHDGYLEG